MQRHLLVAVTLFLAPFFAFMVVVMLGDVEPLGHAVAIVEMADREAEIAGIGHDRGTAATSHIRDCELGSRPRRSASSRTSASSLAAACARNGRDNR